MTLITRARARNPQSMGADGVAVLAGCAAFLLQVIAGWPGWLNSAGVAQWVEARSGQVTDAFPAALTWFWAHADPTGRGPLVPFLLQVFLFWLGVVLLTVGVQPAARWTRWLPLLVAVNPVSWMVVVVSPATTVVCAAMVALGVGSLGLRAFRQGQPRNGTIATLAAGVIMGFAALGAGPLAFVVVPLLMLLTAAMAFAALPAYLGARAQGELAVKAVGLTLVAAVIAAAVLPAVLIGSVGKTRAGEAFYALDAFHVDCAPRWSTGRVTLSPVSPPGLWRHGVAPCSTGRPGDFGTAWLGATAPESEQVLGFGRWLGIVAGNPAIVIGGRLQHATAMLGASYPWAPDLDGDELIAAPAANGSGEDAGAPSRGGFLLTAHAAVTSFLPSMMLLWVFVIPLGVAVWIARRPWVARRIGTLPLLLWAPFAGLALGMATPFNDPSAIAPAAMLGWVLSLVSAALVGATMPASHREPVRFGGPYPTIAQPERADSELVDA